MFAIYSHQKYCTFHERICCRGARKLITFTVLFCQLIVLKLQFKTNILTLLPADMPVKRVFWNGTGRPISGTVYICGLNGRVRTLMMKGSVKRVEPVDEYLHRFVSLAKIRCGLPYWSLLRV